ncbi:ArgE/DapE family deacylase [Halorussus marinus]|uniref:ArgE/DapE family deacylase n=1 Tax=Halorussus marinus TaxID=2505976 RepID=UPI00106E0CDB|nr:ArgE/DapE family deacylase [Halorussus marinus]
MSSEIRREIRSSIDENRDRMLSLLADLIEEPSVSGHEKAAQSVVVEKLESMGLDVDVWEPDVEALRDHPGYFDTNTYEEHGYDDRPNVAATVEGTGTGRSIALAGHIDVVSVTEDKWTHDPWTATREDGRVYGRGACDMKGGLAANVFAIEALRDLGVELAGDVVIESTIDEEAGGTGGALSALERGYRPDAAIITEPYGVPNVGVASAGAMYFQITVPGTAAHAAHGFAGVNAINKAVDIVQALADLDRERKSRISFEPAVNQYPDAEGEVTNLNVGIFESGDWPSTVPDEATVECRIGWPPGETREEVREQVREAVGSVVETDEWLADNPPEFEWFGWNANPHYLDTDHEFAQLTKRNAEAVCGADGEWTGGLAGLDERFYVNYYDIPCPSVGPTGGRVHGADEYVDVDSLVEVAQTVALTAVDWCETA